MNDLVSVIIPVYNVEKYVQRCVDSVLKQSYRNLEVILVDDGTPDQSGGLCDEYLLKDNRAIAIHKPNGGLSDARNYGISLASGKYMAFCDSDDWMEPDILEDALNEAQLNASDVIIWGYSADFVDSKEHIIKRKNYVPEHAIYQKGNAANVLQADNFIGYAWNKLYPSKLLKENNFYFRKGMSLVEDIVFNADVLTKVEKMVFIDQCGTHYNQRKRESLGTKYYSNYIPLKILAWKSKESIYRHFDVTPDILYKEKGDYYMALVRNVTKKTGRGGYCV